jgi:hypothetical protein
VPTLAKNDGRFGGGSAPFAQARSRIERVA